MATLVGGRGFAPAGELRDFSTRVMAVTISAAIDAAGYQLATDPHGWGCEPTNLLDRAAANFQSNPAANFQGDTMNTNPNIDKTQERLAGTLLRLDPSASSAEFQVPHFWGLVTVKGHFKRLDGWLEIDKRQQRQMKLTIDAASLHTGIRMRDKHLRAAAFFDTQNHAEVSFHSTSVSDAGEDRLRVEGELEVAGERVLLKLEPTIHQTDDQLDIEATTTVDQRLLGITWSPLGMTRNPATLIVHARLRGES